MDIAPCQFDSSPPPLCRKQERAALSMIGLHTGGAWKDCMAGFDLRTYLERFPDVCRTKFGRAYNFRALEKDFEQLRAGRRWLVARDILKLFEPTRTPFAQYWPAPRERDLDAILKRDHFYMAPAPSDRDLIERLLAVVHNIGIVSLVLRFVHPERFGVFSTPVVNLLQIHRPTTVELFMAFCDELREWQKHFHLESVADTSTALWTFHEMTKSSNSVPESDAGHAAFDADVWVQRRRVGQALRPFFKKYGPLELGRILVEENPKLAGKVAGEEYERRLRDIARRLGLRLGVKGSTEILFDRLEQNGYITLEQKTLLRRIWTTRNKSVHPVATLTQEEVENMIDTIEQICLAWDTQI